MDDVVKTLSARVAEATADEINGRPSPDEAEAAVRTLIRWLGDDPDREGLRDTPKRVVKAFSQLYAGYGEDPREVLSTGLGITPLGSLVRGWPMNSTMNLRTPFGRLVPACPPLPKRVATTRASGVG